MVVSLQAALYGNTALALGNVVGSNISNIALILGLSALVPLSRLLRAYLYDVSPVDPVALGAASAVLIVSATLAAYVPARRASRIDPLTALRG